MKLLFCGDLCVTDDTYSSFYNGNEKKAFGDLLPVFEAADRVIVNLECAITEEEKGIRKIGPCLKAPLKTAAALKKAGVTECTLSNNHIFDFGKKGLDDTVAELDKHNIGYTGIGDNYEASRRDYIIPSDVGDIAIVNVCEHEYSYATENACGARPFDEFETMHDIRLAKQKNKYVIVVYHGGKELCRYPSPRLMRACREMVRCGADVVLCQHSHIIGSYERFEGAHILYGQGNFCFVKKAADESWNEGLVVSADVNKSGIELSFIPVKATATGIRLATATEKEEILSGMKKRETEIQTGEWKQGWRAFCEEKAEWYNGVRLGEKVEEPGDRDQMFAHYLDCEAHRDVWLELFKTWNNTER